MTFSSFIPSLFRLTKEVSDVVLARSARTILELQPVLAFPVGRSLKEAMSSDSAADSDNRLLLAAACRDRAVKALSVTSIGEHE